jgi:hypothetical protein
MFTALALCFWLLSAQNTGDSLPATRPEPSVDSTDFLLRTVLSDLMGARYQGLEPEKALIIAKDSARISARILPPDPKAGFVLLTPEEIARLKGPFRLQISLRMKWRSADVVDVSIISLPVGAGPHLCCWEVDKRYERTEATWRFVKVVGGGII